MTQYNSCGMTLWNDAIQQLWRAMWNDAIQQLWRAMWNDAIQQFECLIVTEISKWYSCTPNDWILTTMIVYDSQDSMVLTSRLWRHSHMRLPDRSRNKYCICWARVSFGRLFTLNSSHLLYAATNWLSRVGALKLTLWPSAGNHGDA